MKISISKEELLHPLQQVVGVVERKQTHEVMNNLLFEASADQLQITATDNEVELKTTIPLIVASEGKTTIPARKLLDICKSLSDGSTLNIDAQADKAKLSSGRSRFTLATLPCDEFPVVEPLINPVIISLPQGTFGNAIKRTAFAMAQQDVRYYLNGLLMQVTNGGLCCVTTDGHRLAMHRAEAEIETDSEINAIIPRKAISELGRLIDDSDTPIEVRLNSNHMQLKIGALQLTTKLIEGKFPNYEKVIPLASNNVAIVDRDAFKLCLSRGAILANEKYKGVRLSLNDNLLGVQTNNPNHEEAEDELEIDYSGDPIEIGFNVTYLLDVLNALDTETAELNVRDNSSSVVIHPSGNKDSTYVVMPMRL